MDDIQLWGFSVDVVNGVLSIAVIVLPTLAAIIVTALLGAQALPAFRKLVRSLRQYVDQPTDSAVKFIADQLHVTEEQVIAALTKVIDEMGKEPAQTANVSVAVNMPTAEEPSITITPTMDAPMLPPVQEVNIGGTAN